MKLKLEKPRIHKCGCAMRRDPKMPNRWIKYRHCKQHEPRPNK